MLLASSATASLAIEFEPIRSLWGKGDEAKGSALIEGFSFPIVSRYLAISRGQTQETRASDFERRHWIELFFAIFGDEDEARLERILAIDRQYSADQDRQKRIEENGGVILGPELADKLYFSEAVVSLGGEAAVKVATEELPLADYTHESLTDEGKLQRGNVFYDFWSETEVWIMLRTAFAQSVIPLVS